MDVMFTEKEASLIVALIEDEQNCCGYEQYWMEEDRKLFDEIIYKLKSEGR